MISAESGGERCRLYMVMISWGCSSNGRALTYAREVRGCRVDSLIGYFGFGKLCH